MKIANPIYDVVIKYLLEDNEIAKGFISVLIKEEVISIEVKPQEQTYPKSDAVYLMRIDFKAVIKTKDGKFLKVLIEIQKSKSGFKVHRFRRYLGVNYMTQDDILKDQISKKEDLPIIPIYILGFEINGLKVPIIRVKRDFLDEIEGKSLKKSHKYLDALTHDCLIIQLPRLKNMVPHTELEQVLDVFNQEKYKTDDKHILDYAGTSDNPLINKMLYRLNSATVNEELLLNMFFEDEMRENMAEMENAIKAKEAALELAQKLRKEKEQERKEKEQLLNLLAESQEQIKLLLEELKKKS